LTYIIIYANIEPLRDFTMRKSYSSREIIKIIEADGWKLKDVTGDHHHFVHDTIKGKVTIPHPVKALPAFILSIIQKQTGLKF
jgi:predicted RNA binding protein YcfA (HicA-like mRNA interferase family)